ncbi:MAG TPA: PEP/pyruvate-binding domain-containing protein [Anaerolineales bacterium]|nr:PEP/pyruvate-binding domain-containing protein [Anaerolineales bacterium]
MRIMQAGQSGLMSVQIDQALADKMVERAVAQCAQTHFAGDARRARQALLRGQCEHCQCVSDYLVEQIGETLGQVAGSVRAVYRLEAMEAPARTEGQAPERHAGIHLVIWVDRKSPALRALAGTLETVLADSQRRLGCPFATPDCYTLDMEMVDDRDVRERRGFGLLVERPQLRARPVWDRSVGPSEVDHEEEVSPGSAGMALPLSFDPELIPESRLIEHALSIERLPTGDRAALEHHLTELKVTLIRRIVSDQLDYINIAKRWFTVADLADIYRRRLAFGRIGGKSAGMLLAARILNEVGGEDLRASVSVPESFYLGSDLMYIFMAMNGLMHWNDQKYKPEDQIRAEYPQIQEEFVAGEFPPEILVEFQAMLEQIGRHPLIVRSSSQLEDSLGTSFAGKYDSHFCPNQGTPQENLQALTRAIASTYASTFRPDPLLYRRSRGLQDYDERMAALIQVVQGEKWGRYYFPFAAGVGFSRNLYRWAPHIRREDGFARLVWGLGTRAVERVGNDYPRLVALSHPTLQPDDSPQAIRRYSQQYVDLIDLQDNRLKTLPIGEALTPRYPALRLLAQLEEDGYLATPRGLTSPSDLRGLAITFDGLLGRTPFPSLLSELLQHLEKHWGSAVDVEFTAHIPDPHAAPAQIKISLLQCRPLPSLQTAYQAHLPEGLSDEEIVFSSHFMVPQGYLRDIQHVIFVVPEKYFALPSAHARSEVGRIIGRLNSALPKKSFLCVGPGRWGTENHDLGVYVGYADICNAGALVELSGREVGPAPEPSLGTHFFHDLMEAQIYPVALSLDREDTLFNQRFFYDTPNSLREWVDVSEDLGGTVRLIEVRAFRAEHHLELVMDDESGVTVAFLARDGE